MDDSKFSKKTAGLEEIEAEKVRLERSLYSKQALATDMATWVLFLSNFIISFTLATVPGELLHINNERDALKLGFAAAIYASITSTLLITRGLWRLSEQGDYNMAKQEEELLLSNKTMWDQVEANFLGDKSKGSIDLSHDKMDLKLHLRQLFMQEKIDALNAKLDANAQSNLEEMNLLEYLEDEGTSSERGSIS